MTSPLARAGELCERYGIGAPILLAPMAGACPAGLSIAVARAGGMGAAGLLLNGPAEIAAWMDEFRAGGGGAVQLNLWVPDPPPVRDPVSEQRVRAFLEGWGPAVASDAGDATPPDFGTQCAAALQVRPTALSSIMGLFPPAVVAQMKADGVAWFATATTVDEALQAEAAGADVIVAQGAEAGGHRGAFEPTQAERRLVGLVALVPAVADAVRVPVVAAGGIADGRGVAAALALGASAVQVGTAFLRCPEARVHPAWAAALARTRPEETMITRAFSGRPGRSIATAYARAAAESDAPAPAPYPVQRGLTAGMRADAQKAGDVQRMQAWAGQAAALARPEPAAVVTRRLWEEARRLLA